MLAGRASLAVIALAAAVVSAPVRAETIGGYEVGVWNKTKWSSVPTDCDRLASYGPDRDAVAPPLAHEQIDVPVAITACRAAIAAEPGNPRFHYQLARLLGYAKDERGAKDERVIAAAAGYPSALYVLGHIKAFAKDASGDRCGGAALIRRAADLGAFAGQVGLASYQFDGSFAGCPAAAPKAVLVDMLALATKGAHGHFESLLVASLQREVARLP